MSGAKYTWKRNRWRINRTTLLMIIWLSGLLFGLVLAEIGDALFRRLTQTLFATPQKYMLSILPFLFSAVAVFFSRPRWLYCICGVKAVLFAVSCFLLCDFFGHAGWLAYCLFMFADVCSLPFLYCYWLRNLSNDRSRGVREYFILLPILASIVVDYRIVSPYATKFGLF